MENKIYDFGKNITLKHNLSGEILEEAENHMKKYAIQQIPQENIPLDEVSKNFPDIIETIHYLLDQYFVKLGIDNAKTTPFFVVPYEEKNSGYLAISKLSNVQVPNIQIDNERLGELAEGVKTMILAKLSAHELYHSTGKTTVITKYNKEKNTIEHTIDRVSAIFSQHTIESAAIEESMAVIIENKIFKEIKKLFSKK